MHRSRLPVTLQGAAVVGVRSSPCPHAANTSWPPRARPRALSRCATGNDTATTPVVAAEREGRSRQRQRDRYGRGDGGREDHGQGRGEREHREPPPSAERALDELRAHVLGRSPPASAALSRKAFFSLDGSPFSNAFHSSTTSSASSARRCSRSVARGSVGETLEMRPEAPQILAVADEGGDVCQGDLAELEPRAQDDVGELRGRA